MLLQPAGWRIGRNLSRVVVVAVAFVIFTAFLLPPAIRRRNERPDPPGPPFAPSAFLPLPKPQSGATDDDLCAPFPHNVTSRIQPVLRIGHAESKEKLDAQFDSMSRCWATDELLVFSDSPDTIRGRPVVDIIAANPPEVYRVDNPDYEPYDALQEMRRNHTGGIVTPEEDPARGKGGWKIDKFKFLPMVQAALTERPGRDWYVFYETDSYVMWDNLFRFLDSLDPSRPWYIGSPSPGRRDEDGTGTHFVYGGPGFVLSRAAIVRLLEGRISKWTGAHLDEPDLLLRWKAYLRNDPCGDCTLGWALYKAGVLIDGFYPMWTPNAPDNVNYSERKWCQPVIAMHRTTPKDTVDLWRWEQSRRTPERPILYADLWDFHHPESDLKPDWDNGCWDRMPLPPSVPPTKANPDPPPIPVPATLYACRAACEASEKCMQYRWREGAKTDCVLASSIEYGREKKPGKEKDGDVEFEASYTSGYMLDRFRRWRETKDDCKDMKWLGPSLKKPDRYF